MTRPLIFCILAAAAATWGAITGKSARAADAGQARPNIVVVLVDDERWDDLGCMGNSFLRTPNIDRLAHEGVKFTNAFVTTPLCSPSRATFLTGQYAHRHGITDNTDHDEASHRLKSFPWILHDAGYATAFVGKWHMGVDDTPRPGFDFWVGMHGQGHYLDPELNVDGRRIQTRGYVTDILTDYAVRFLDRDRDRPFCLYFAHKALHPEVNQNADGSLSDLASASTFIPADRHKALYADVEPSRRANFGAPHGKPALERKIDDLPPLTAATATTDEQIRNRWRTMAAVDESVGRIYELLRRRKQLDNTVFVFTSDQGYFYGEHGLSVERRLAYEESIRIPLIVRFPSLARPNRSNSALVLNLDLAPTLLAVAGVAAPSQMEGRSFLPLLSGRARAWRDSFLIEYYSDRVFPRMQNMGYRAIRTETDKLIHYTDLSGMDEYYNLADDPCELKNLIALPASARRVQQLREKIAEFTEAAPASLPP